MSEILVEFRGTGAGTAELTWGQLRIWRTAKETGRTMNLVLVMPLPEETPLAHMVATLRSVVSDHPALRTTLRFEGPDQPWQVVAESGQVPLQIVDIDDENPAEVAEELRSRYELTGFDYEHEFPIRMGVVRQSGVLRAMVVGYSHVMIDGAGLAALVRAQQSKERLPGLNPLELARVQYGPAGRRQTIRCLRYWEAQVRRLSSWHQQESGDEREPRFQELVMYSPAMEVALRLIQARTSTHSTYVLVAAYAVAVTRVLGRDPAVAQIVASNRFRPGFANAVLQVSQPSICVIETMSNTFDEVVVRAANAATTASYFAYYDPVERDKLLDKLEAKRGRPLDISWHINDRREATHNDEAPTTAELKDALPHTKSYWDNAQPTFDGTLFIQVDSKPTKTSREALNEGPPAIYLEVWADTRHFTRKQIEALIAEMEVVLVTAAFDENTAASKTEWTAKQKQP